MNDPLAKRGLLRPVKPSAAPLRERYRMPPFSVLNTRDGQWQARKRQWLSLGIQSEVGRHANLLDISAMQAAAMGVIDGDDPQAVEEWNKLRREMRAATGRTESKRATPESLTKEERRLEPGGGGGPNSAYGRWGKPALSGLPNSSDLPSGHTSVDDLRQFMGQKLKGGAGKQGEAYNDHEWVETVLGKKAPAGSGTSIFDPVLTELSYSWFCPPAGIIVDPFAGGSVRGIVASVLGYRYWGCELRTEQVLANQAQIKDGEPLVGKYQPKWKQGDSFDILASGPPADFVFSCPPYGNLEQYSDDPADLSAMEYPQFLERYSQIIGRACRLLKQDRFAAFVVSNFRDQKTGTMRDFVGDTIRAFEAAGVSFYNDAVLINAVGTAAVRAEGNFSRGGRKLVKLHQNLLVFVKGNPKNATAAID